MENKGRINIHYYQVFRSGKEWSQFICSKVLYVEGKILVNFRLWVNYTVLNLWSKQKNKKGIFIVYMSGEKKDEVVSSK